MDEKKIPKNEYKEIDLNQMFRAVMGRAWLVVLMAVLCAIIAFAVTVFFVTPQYQSSAMFYVNNGSVSLGDASVSISSGDLSASRNLVESYIVILKSRESLNDVIDYAGVDRTYSELKGMISAEAVNDTEIFEVVVTSPDPNEAKKIASAITYLLPNRISSIIENTSAKVVDSPVRSGSPSSPSYATNAVVGFLIGLVLTVAVIVLREMFDVTIRTEEDVEQSCKHPILAEVPNMAAPGKGSSYYGYGYGRSARQNSKSTANPAEPRVVLGPNISFAASEAYKLLRTKLQFSFADENDCYIIGLSSALSGEGKSLTAVNLAYTLSQLDKKVLLIDCDMRRPTLAEKLGINKKPGLSSYLTNQCDLDELVQCCVLKKEESPFYVISAGPNPPNPVELLSSDRMKNLLVSLRGEYDYIIVDLPPVGEVSDAMAVTKQIDGMLLVVRQNYCDRAVLTSAVRQFEFIETRILGVVFNCTSEHGGKYGKGYYKRYYRCYGRGYYERGDRSAAENDRRRTK